MSIKWRKIGLLVFKTIQCPFSRSVHMFRCFCIVLDKSDEINKINIFQSLLSFLISLVKEQKTRSYLEACNESFYMNMFNFNRRSNMEFLFTFKKEKHWFRRFYSDCMKWPKLYNYIIWNSILKWRVYVIYDVLLPI